MVVTSVGIASHNADARSLTCRKVLVYKYQLILIWICVSQNKKK